MVVRGRTILYAVEASDRAEPFTADMELAALYALAESRRKKGGGRIFKRKGETWGFLAKAYYPLRVKAYRGSILLFDLLGLNKAAVKYRVMPGLDPLLQSLSSTRTAPAFDTLLMKALSLLDKFEGEEVVEIDGLINRPELSSELHFLLRESRGFRKEDRAGSLLFTPVVNKERVEEGYKAILGLKRRVRSDIEELERVKRRLGRKMHLIHQAITREIDEIKRKGKRKVEVMRARMARSLQARKRALERDLKRIDREYERKASSLSREKERYEKRLSTIKGQIGALPQEYQPRFQTLSPEERSKVEEAVRALKRAMRELEDKIKGIERALKELEAWRASQRRQLQKAFEEATAAEEAKIKGVEEERERAVEERMSLLNRIYGRVEALYSKIDALIGVKREDLKELDSLAIKVKGKTTNLYIPFYLVSYRNQKERFDLYPPVSASRPKGRPSGSLEDRMSKLLVPRYKFIDQVLLKGMRTALQESPPFRNIVRRAGEEADLLRRPKAVERIRRGLRALRREGWLTDKEYLAIEDSLLPDLGG